MKRRSGEERNCRRIVEERADAHCERCGTHESVRGLTLHHRVKRSQGGPWTPQNCVMLCGHGTTPDGCHCWVEHNPDAAEVKGFHVRPWRNPNNVSLLYRGVWVFLNENGTITKEAA